MVGNVKNVNFFTYRFCVYIHVLIQSLKSAFYPACLLLNLTHSSENYILTSTVIFTMEFYLVFHLSRHVKALLMVQT